MDYSGYTSGNTKITETTVSMSDGVTLKVIDFTPGNNDDQKPVIVFVAGWISLISGWKGVLKEITPEFRTLYVESREKQSSVVPEKVKVSYTIDRLKEDIREVVNTLVPENKKFVLAGSSLGATVILEYCASDYRKPECALLVAPNEEFRFPKILGAIVPLVPPSMYFLIKPVIKWYLRNFRLDKKREQEQIKKYEYTLDCADPYKLKANALALRNYSIWDSLKSISTPCVIFGATTDKLHDTEMLKRMINALPEVQYIELTSNSDTHSEKAGRIMVDYLDQNEYRTFSHRVH